MLKIRLQRTGRENKPFYRIVVAEHAAPVKAKYVDLLGFYNPIANPRVFKIDLEKAKGWISKGAKPSNTVARLMKGEGIEGMDAYIVPMADRKKKKEAAAAPNGGQAESTSAAPAAAPDAAPEKTS